MVGVFFREEEWDGFGGFYGGKVGVCLGLMDKGRAVVFSRNLRPWCRETEEAMVFFFLSRLCWCLKWRGTMAGILGID